MTENTTAEDIMYEEAMANAPWNQPIDYQPGMYALKTIGELNPEEEENFTTLIDAFSTCSESRLVTPVHLTLWAIDQVKFVSNRLHDTSWVEYFAARLREGVCITTAVFMADLEEYAAPRRNS